ncbi:AAA family ATPase [Actinocrispum wychmicini]|uniref:Putative kinase n=1 Tax=Actinocrispum wychmicini TaxID=1213861 RepID=A0A4R2JV77_9PSEU|nr:AAA family ATPase [Actinocrispum wychmicini]TCO60949.1 putative kinase [Actinocrispum wychmicini]
MEPFDRHCPTPPHWTLTWRDIRDEFPWVRRLARVPQDWEHHREGDVETHTRMACEALAALPEWRARPTDERVRLFAAVLLHDVAKPFCTQVAPEGITAHGHSRLGDLLVRRILWDMGTPPAWREHVAALVRHHQIPFWALERDDIERIAFRVSLLARNDDLVLLAKADILGRICTDAATLVDNVSLYGEYCAELDCLSTPRRFPSDHARFMYFRTPGRDPDYAAYDDTRLTMTLVAGLPGVGKDHWLTHNRPDLPRVSLDALRTELKVKPTADQGPVIAAANARAREHLRAGRSFVWNATNVSRQVRDQAIGLAAAYRARIEIIGLEAPMSVITARNAARPDPVPASVIEKLANKWEAPDPTEAHTVRWLTTA